MLRKHLFITLSSITIALLISSISISLAWYSTGNELKVDNIEVSFRGDKQIKLSTTKDGEYKETLANEDLPGIKEFYPVSSMYSSKWLKEKSQYPVFKDNYYLASIANPNTYKESKDAKGGYITSEVYIKSDHDVYATLDDELFSLVPDEDKNLLKAKELKTQFDDKSEEDIFQDLNTIKDSLRVSILYTDNDTYEYYIIDPYKNKETLFAGTLDNTKSGYYDYYTLNDTLEKKEFVYGEYQNEDKIIYDEASLSDSELRFKDQELNAFNARTKSGVKKFNLAASLNNGFNPARENSLTPKEAHEKILIPLPAYEEKRLVISIYLEGWDLDNTNLSMYGSFIANVKFKIAKEMI